MLLYWYRLENLGKDFPLLKEAYNETKLLYLSKKPSWYGSINIIVNILKTTNTDSNLLLKKTLGKFKNNVKKVLKSLFITEWKKQINKFSEVN
jgi:hypothetical protein